MNKIDYEKETYTDEDIGQTDTKIHPEYYIHHAIIKAQNALIEDDPKTGFLKFRVLVEHLEALAHSACVVTPDEEIQENKSYTDLIKEYEKSQDKIKDVKEHLKQVRIANYKFKLICSKAFESKTITSPLQDGLSSHYTKGVIDKVGKAIIKELQKQGVTPTMQGHIQNKINELKDAGV